MSNLKLICLPVAGLSANKMLSTVPDPPMIAPQPQQMAMRSMAPRKLLETIAAVPSAPPPIPQPSAPSGLAVRRPLSTIPSALTPPPAPPPPSAPPKDPYATLNTMPMMQTLGGGGLAPRRPLDLGLPPVLAMSNIAMPTTRVRRMLPTESPDPSSPVPTLFGISFAFPPLFVLTAPCRCCFAERNTATGSNALDVVYSCVHEGVCSSLFLCCCCCRQTKLTFLIGLM